MRCFLILFLFFAILPLCTVHAIMFSLGIESPDIKTTVDDFVEIEILVCTLVDGRPVFLERAWVGYHQETLNKAGESAAYSRLKCGDLRSIDLGHFSTFVRSMIPAEQKFYFFVSIKKNKKILYTGNFPEQNQDDEDAYDSYFISVLYKGDNEYIVNPGPIVVGDV